jgi:hypothetical protein
MKTYLLSVLLGLHSFFVFGQQKLPHRPSPYIPKTDSVKYFGTESITHLLNHIGVYYCSVPNRMIVKDTLSHLYRGNILNEFDEFVSHKTDDGIQTFPNINRVMISFDDFFKNNEFIEDGTDFNFNDVLKIMSSTDIKIIGLKEWKIPPNTKPYQFCRVCRDCTIDLTQYKSILILEIYIPNNNEVDTIPYIRYKNNRLKNIIEELMGCNWCNK